MRTSHAMDTLVISCQVDGGEVHVAARLAPNRGAPWSFPQFPRQTTVQRLVETAEVLTTALREAVLAVSRLDPPADLQLASTCLRGLRQAGSRLTETLLPPPVAEWLAANGSGHVIFECDPRLNGVPFHLLVVERDFLGFQCAVGKQLWTPGAAQRTGRPARPLPWRTAHVVDPGNLLPEAAVSEFAFPEVGNEPNPPVFRVGAMLRSRPVTKEQVQTLLRESDAFNFFGHHRHEPGRPETDGWVLGPEPDEVFTAGDFLAAFPPGSRPPALLVAAACDSGTTSMWEEDWPETRRVHGLADAASRAGVDHFVGSMVALPGKRTGRLFAPFYAALIGGRSLGDALRHARRAFRDNPDDPDDPGTLFGLPFVLYGDPTAGVVCAEGHPVSDQTARFCEAPVGHGFCGRLVCESDSGFPGRRCAAHRVQRRCSAGHPLDDTTQVVRCSHHELGGTPCGNLVCERCSGWSRALCHEHCSHEGRPILAGTGRLCRDPQRRHPEEKRSIAPGESGYLQGLCRECLEAASTAAAPLSKKP
ncbi:MAG: CHAT domain-containing protein [Verrucomicrobia bacterium]|nr:MAG: CHAT domain-containing protein [Verrucomicrobiota bacterium]